MEPEVSIEHVSKATCRFTTGGEIFSSVKCGIFICMAGCVTLGNGDTTYTLTPGSLFIYTVANFVTIVDISEDSEGIIIDTDIEYLLGIVGSIMDVPSILHIRHNPLIKLDENSFHHIINQANELQGLIHSIARNGGNDITARIDRQIMHAGSTRLTLTILKEYFACHPPCHSTVNRSHRIYQEFMVLLFKEYSRHRDIKFYAGMQNLSPRHFSTVIKQASGISPSAIIDQVIISEARKMLSSGKMTVKEVAAALNFPSQSFFGKYFKKHTGISPSEFRSSLYPITL